MGYILTGTGDYNAMPIVGYTDRPSVEHGDKISLFVSASEGESYSAELVRLFNGDMSPAGAGVKEELISAAFNGEYRAVVQDTHMGSYATAPDHHTTRGESGLYLQVFVCPTTPIGSLRGVITKVDDAGRGYGLFINDEGHLVFQIADANNVATFENDYILAAGVWYRLCVSLDPEHEEIVLLTERVPGAFNSRLGVDLRPQGRTTRLRNTASLPGDNDAPIILGACNRSGLISNHFNGKLDRPIIGSGPLDAQQMLGWDVLHLSDVAATWDMSYMPGEDLECVVDQGPNGLDAILVNLPTRAVTGHNWSGREYNFIHARNEYAAVHFHEDDIYDLGWMPSFEYEVPNSLTSGVYAARLRMDIPGRDDGEEDYVPFIVRPQIGKPGAEIALIMPTATYMAYANDNMAADEEVDVLESTIGSVPIMGAQDLARQVHREFGISTYDTHVDGSGGCYTSWLRPMLNVRPKYRHTLSEVWQFNADLHIVDWCQELGFQIDVFTDHDIDTEGADLLSPYRVVITGTHPEYYTAAMLDAMETYIADGGRVIYMGGNGFYWVAAFHPQNRSIMEVRKFGGTEAWTAEPGQRYLSFSGELGGLWRNRGRPPQKLVGVGFIAQGLDRSSYYLRRPDSFHEQVSWIFDGVAADEVIGDFGIEGGGAAGMEIDCYDPNLGSPGHAYLLASSVDHTRLMLEVRENFGITRPFMGGPENPLVRADMVYFDAANGGGVFSTGSIAWSGSLSANNYDNNVSRITANVVSRFLSTGKGISPTRGVA